MRQNKRLARAFALYEVLLGLAVFAIGVLVLGRSIEHCMNASALSADEDRIRLILANRMAEIQATPGFPDRTKESKVDTGYGEVRLVQSAGPAGLKDDRDLEMGGIFDVVLMAEWTRGGQKQTRKIEFYVYRVG